MMVKPIGKKQVLLGALILFLGGAAVCYAAYYTQRTAVAESQATALERLLLYESTLRSALNQYRYLPYILAIDPKVQNLVEKGGDPAKVNAYLEAVNAEAGSAALYVIDSRGVTLASSNWNSPHSYIGQDYHFRPYFREAMAGREGVFYGVGLTTKVPGYFMSYPIRENGQIIGAAAIKVELHSLQKDWREGGETVFVTDQHGIIILATREEWRYQALDDIDDEQLAGIQSDQRYQGARLARFSAVRGQRAGMTELAVGNERFLMESRALAGLDWRIHFLEPAHKVDEQTLTVAAVGVATLVLLGLLGLLGRENHLRKVSRQRAREAQRIHLINQQLEAEVHERRRKERELRETQDELIHAGQMAALGQMAASVAHELNQPLSAIRMFSANCKVMLQRGQQEAVLDNLQTIHDLTGRLAAVASQLKSFSRKSARQREKVDLRQSLRNALGLLAHQAEIIGCRIDRREPDEPLLVQANPMHLDQVFVNLLQNSLDAVRESPTKVVSVELRRVDGHAEAVIADSGPGLSPEAKERLFSPFFTTKEPGQGLGLGLSIIHGIIRDMQGEINGENLEGGGACFTVRLLTQNDG
jgi:two-component system C4-dicarboxylate transport sensor histidine kinase DctB